MSNKKYHRVFVDGCFDLCHFGHYNFIRQASQLGDELYAGVHNDEEILKNKGPVVLTLEERIEMIEACKWVTKTVPDSPYNVTTYWLDKYNCDCNVHGDDLALNADGVECHEPVRRAGRFETVPRTKAISTTNLIGRILRLSNSELPEELRKDLNTKGYLPSTFLISHFSSLNEPKKTDVIVYCDGTFDMLHPGHVSFLKKAKQMGTYLVVGIHEDKDVISHGKKKPIMNIHERVLNLLALKYVDDVIIGAPYVINEELIQQVVPAIVVEGSNLECVIRDECYEIPKKLGIYKKIESDYPEFTSQTIINRILDNYNAYIERNALRENLPCENI
ncbi:Ethanolamine-phosphate cytidylyltransferase [Tritrichomonas musculus]|uniref:ethanolamine-phosphate cytidylyltransferase n=1 Tax=Tritrichomonas musculus TaxID=1915356 RepID=A0ABR2I891_9EUKA